MVVSLGTVVRFATSLALHIYGGITLVILVTLISLIYLLAFNDYLAYLFAYVLASQR